MQARYVLLGADKRTCDVGNVTTRCSQWGPNNTVQLKNRLGKRMAKDSDGLCCRRKGKGIIWEWESWMGVPKKYRRHEKQECQRRRLTKLLFSL